MRVTTLKDAQALGIDPKDFPKHNKFNVSPVELRTWVSPTGERIVFDSRTEMQRWCHLLLLKRCGQIEGLDRQAPYVYTGHQGQTLFTYEADFHYYDRRLMRWVVEDVKGCTKGAAYALFQLKRRLIEDQYGFKMTVVRWEKKEGWVVS